VNKESFGGAVDLGRLLASVETWLYCLALGRPFCVGITMSVMVLFELACVAGAELGSNQVQGQRKSAK
jgi:hypothetical protein